MVDRFGIRRRMPSRSDLPDVPTLSRERRFQITLVVAAAILVSGSTLLLSGVVLTLMMALEGAALHVVVTSAMVSLGLVLVAATYLWLTAPT